MDKKELQEKLDKLSMGAVKTYKKDGYLSSVFLLMTLFTDGKKMLGVIPLCGNKCSQELSHRAEVLRQAGAMTRTDPKVKDIEAVLLISEVFLGSPESKKKEGVVIAGMTQKGEQAINVFEVSKKKWWKKKCLKKTNMKGFKSGDIKMNLLGEFWKTYQQIKTA